MKKGLELLGNELLQFFIGLVMTVVGGYLFMQNVEVTSMNFFETYLFGRRMNGIVFVPLIASLIYLFFRYCTASKICVTLSILIIIANVIANLRMRWMTVTLFATIVIFVLLFGGIGLMLKCIFVNPNGKYGKDYNEGKNK